MRTTRVALRPVCAGSFEERYGRVSESRKIPVIRSVAISDDRRMPVDVPSLIAPRLFQNLDEEGWVLFVPGLGFI